MTDFLKQGRAFATTHWSLVLAAGDETSAEAQDAFSALYRLYWYPVYAAFRRQGRSPHDAEDLTQGFFLHLSRKNRLSKVGPEKGRFRSFLLASLKNYHCNEIDRAGALKRGGGCHIVPLDGAAAERYLAGEPSLAETPEAAFDRRWATEILRRGLEELEAFQRRTGNGDRFAQLKPLLLAETGATNYREVGRQLGMTESAVKVAVMRLRQRLRELFRQEVAQTVARMEDVDSEMGEILAALRH